MIKSYYVYSCDNENWQVTTLLLNYLDEETRKAVKNVFNRDDLYCDETDDEDFVEVSNVDNDLIFRMTFETHKLPEVLKIITENNYDELTTI